MAAEWLRADQVQAITARVEASGVRWVNLMLPGEQATAIAQMQLRADVLALCAQDGRWRALVGALLAAAADGEAVKISYVHGTWYSALSPRFQDALQMAQAALDGAPDD